MQERPFKVCSHGTFACDAKHGIYSNKWRCSLVKRWRWRLRKGQFTPEESRNVLSSLPLLKTNSKLNSLKMRLHLNQRQMVSLMGRTGVDFIYPVWRLVACVVWTPSLVAPETILWGKLTLRMINLCSQECQRWCWRSRIKRREWVARTRTRRTQSVTIGHAIFNNLWKVHAESLTISNNLQQPM